MSVYDPLTAVINGTGPDDAQRTMPNPDELALLFAEDIYDEEHCRFDIVYAIRAMRQVEMKEEQRENLINALNSCFAAFRATGDTVPFGPRGHTTLLIVGNSYPPLLQHLHRIQKYMYDTYPMDCFEDEDCLNDDDDSDSDSSDGLPSRDELDAQEPNLDESSDDTDDSPGPPLSPAFGSPIVLPTLSLRAAVPL